MSQIAQCRPALGTFVKIALRGEVSEDALLCQSVAAFAEIARLERLLSFHDPQSELSRVNREALHRPVTVSAEMTAVLSLARRLSAATNGAFDLTVAAELVKRGALPDHRHQAQATGCWRDLHLEDGQVRFARPLLIDLGGIAKGFCVDRAFALRRAQRLGFCRDVYGGGRAHQGGLPRPRPRSPAARARRRRLDRRRRGKDHMGRRARRRRGSPRIPHRYRLLLFALVGASWVSGVMFFIMDRWVSVEGEFGPEKHPWQAVILKGHGAAAFLMMIAFGSLLVAHVAVGWSARRLRRSGLPLLIAQGFLIVSAYGLYYLGDDQLRSLVSYAHAGVGVSLPVLLAVHLYQRRRRRRGADRADRAT